LIRGINRPTNRREAGGGGASAKDVCGEPGSSDQKSIWEIDFREDGVFGFEIGSGDGALCAPPTG
jgi:hypothetical protein